MSHSLAKLPVLPNSVLVGETLTLQHEGKKHAPLSQVKFYKDEDFLYCCKDTPPTAYGSSNSEKQWAVPLQQEGDSFHTQLHRNLSDYQGPNPR